MSRVRLFLVVRKGFGGLRGIHAGVEGLGWGLGFVEL